MKKDLLDVMKPGVMTGQIWQDADCNSDRRLRAVEKQLATRFFSSLQVLDIPCASERRALRTLLEQMGGELNYCLARLIAREKLELASPDRNQRQKAVAQILQCLDEARETGARYVQVMSGPAPSDPSQRMERLNYLCESLVEIAMAAFTDPPLTVLIEPLDVHVHKKGVLGFTHEAVALIESARQVCHNTGLILDTAHCVLNDENPEEMLRSASYLTAELHLCNCVTKPDHPLYGDHHIPFGEPGWMTQTRTANILKKGLEVGFLSEEHPPRVFMEVRTPDNDSPDRVFEQCRTFLEDAWMEMEAGPPK